MPDPIKIIDHDAQAQDRKAEQFKYKVAFAAVLAAYTTQIQALEDMFWDLFALRNVDTAVGTQLDVLGKIVGELRGGSPDPDYRLRIRARIRANLSNGVIEDIYAVFRALIGAASLPGVTFTYVNSFPAGFILTIGNYILAAAFVPIFVGFLRDSRGAAIEAHFGWQEQSNADTFYFLGGPGIKGFGDDSDPTKGGDLIGMLKA